MNKIELSRGMHTLVDDEDYEKLNRFKWCAKPSRGKFYAARTFWKKGIGGYGKQSIHRIVMNAPEGVEVDHLNGDSLDNRKENLRLTDHKTNSRNRKAPRTGTSGYLGVSRRSNGWVAQMWSDGNYYDLGTYPTSEEAASVRIATQIDLWGEQSVSSL